MNNHPDTPPDLRAGFGGTLDLSLILGADLRIVAVSDAYCRAAATERDRLVGLNVFGAFESNQAGALAGSVGDLRTSLGRVLELRRPDAMVGRTQRIARPVADGGGFKERVWSAVNTPVLDREGNVAWIIHRVELATDHARRPNDGDRGTAERPDELAEWQRTEASVKSASEFYNLVVENIPAMVFVKDAAEHRFLFVNRAGEQLLGVDRSELIGKNDYDFFPKEQADYFIGRDREVLLSGKLQDTPEEPINTRHQGVRLLHTMKIPVLDEAGRPKFLVALIEDITERKRAEAALQASEAMFRGLLAASPDAVIVVDSSGRILLASHRVEAMFGYASDELVGKPFGVLLPESERDAYADRLRRVVADPRSGVSGTGRELRALRKDGSEFPAEISLGVNRTESADVVIAAIRDITDRLGVEMQLRQAQKMEAIGNLTGGLAHDFNNLLGIIVGSLDILAERQRMDADSEELTREALDAALRGADLTQRLLAFARRQPLQPQRIDINELVDRITRLLRRTLVENIEITLDRGAGVWPVVVDPAQLEASLLNIVNNARDAMPRGGLLTIVTTNRSLDEDYAALHPGLAPGNYAVIEIGDSGTGIPPEILGRIFEPFFTTKEQGKGTGLGLSMVFGFMKQSGGHINVYSEPGVGTTFRLYLPRAAEATAAEEAALVTPQERGGRETILAVEDNSGLRRVVARQLKELGYRLLEAEDGPAALKILETEPVDLLFTDVVMPGGMSGYDLARAAAARWPGLKVVLTSGFPEVKLNGNGGPQLNMRLLVKPYRKADLARLLREALDG